MKKIRNILDIAYIIIALAALVLDIFIDNAVLERVASLLVAYGYLFTLVNFVKYRKDERLNQVHLLSSFYSFAFTITGLTILSILPYFYDLSLTLNDTIRYLSMLMLLCYTISVAVIRRRI